MTFKNRILCVLMSCFIALSFSACGVGDIVEAGAPSGVSQQSPTISTPQKPTSSEESKEESQIDNDTIDYPLEMWFASGVGAWYTKLTIHANGSFSGEFHDSNMGEIGDDYPNGTTYECKFSGYFSNPQKVNDYTYSLTLETIEIEGEIGESRIADGMLYKTSSPHGLMNVDDTGYAKEFLLYTPNAPTSEMREEFLSWWPERFGADPNGQLLIYGLQNVETSDGFFTAKEN
ncbi:MAG: hypothetical protein IJA44_01540 [Clostridia bacterium]|nr:hypothetical protein [Clostridia bacterium]